LSHLNLKIKKIQILPGAWYLYGAVRHFACDILSHPATFCRRAFGLLDEAIV